MLIRYLINLASGNQNAPLSRRERREQRRYGGQQNQTSAYDTAPVHSGYPQQQQPYSRQQQHYPQQQQHHDQAGNSYATSTTYPPAQSHEPKRPFWDVWLPRLRLMGAVFLPVILETLDYTSMSSSVPSTS